MKVRHTIVRTLLRYMTPSSEFTTGAEQLRPNRPIRKRVSNHRFSELTGARWINIREKLHSFPPESSPQEFRRYIFALKEDSAFVIFSPGDNRQNVTQSDKSVNPSAGPLE